MDERYGADQSQSIQDTQWIEEATLAGDVLLCKDLAIAQNPLEAQAIYMTSARVFALSNAADRRADHGAVVPGQRGEDRQDGSAGQGAVRHGGKPVLRPAPGEAGLSAGLTPPNLARPLTGRVACKP